MRLDDNLLRSELAIVEGQLFEIKARLVGKRDDLASIEMRQTLIEVALEAPEFDMVIDG